MISDSDLIRHIENSVFQYLELDSEVLQKKVSLVVVFVPVIGIFLERNTKRKQELLTLHELTNFRYTVGFNGFHSYPNLRYLWEAITDYGPEECMKVSSKLWQIDPLVEIYQEILSEAIDILPSDDENIV